MRTPKLRSLLATPHSSADLRTQKSLSNSLFCNILTFNPFNISSCGRIPPIFMKTRIFGGRGEGDRQRGLVQILDGLSDNSYDRKVSVTAYDYYFAVAVFSVNSSDHLYANCDQFSPISCHSFLIRPADSVRHDSPLHARQHAGFEPHQARPADFRQAAAGRSFAERSEDQAELKGIGSCCRRFERESGLNHRPVRPRSSG